MTTVEYEPITQEGPINDAIGHLLAQQYVENREEDLLGSEEAADALLEHTNWDVRKAAGYILDFYTIREWTL